MKHTLLLKTINTIFKEDWTGKKVRLDSSVEVKDLDPYISISYTPEKTKQRYLSAGDQGLKFSGTLRVYTYDKNQTKSMESLDEIINFLKNKKIRSLLFKELDGLGKPFRSTTGQLYMSFVDFEVCLIH